MAYLSEHTTAALIDELQARGVTCYVGPHVVEYGGGLIPPRCQSTWTEAPPFQLPGVNILQPEDVTHQCAKHKGHEDVHATVLDRVMWWQGNGIHDGGDDGS